MSAYAKPTNFILGTLKNTSNIFTASKNRVRGLCVNGDMVILCFGSFYGKMTTSPPTHLIFGTVIDIVRIIDHIKNQVGGSCVGGD